MKPVIAFACLVVALAVVAPAAAEEPKKRPLDELQGKWRMVLLGTDTKELPATKLKELALELTVKDDRAELRSKDNVLDRYRLTIDPTATPTQIDLLRLDEKGQPRRAVRPKREGGIAVQEELGPLRGLIEVAGDRLRITYGGNETVGRPKAFDDWRTNNSVLGWTFERVKE